MATPVAQIVKVNWKLVFPWLALFRALGLALHGRQICVGVTAVLLIAVGERLIGGIPFPQNIPALEVGSPLISWVLLPWVDVAYPLVSPAAFRDPVAVISRETTGSWTWLQPLLRFVWILVVSSLAGGVLVRRAGMEFAKEDSVGLLATIRFVMNRCVDYLSAPTLPLAAVWFLGLLLWCTGLLIRAIPDAAYLVSAAWGCALIIGIVMAVLSIAVFLAWPMMIAAVSINGGDGFDGLSRGFGFVLDRWRYYAWCVGIMATYGSLSLLLAVEVLRLGDFFAITSLSAGANETYVRFLPEVLPGSVWPCSVSLVVRGFAYSFFWSSMAMIYLVLRQSLDNAELHDIYVEGTGPESDGLPSLVNPVQPAPQSPTLLPIINQP